MTCKNIARGKIYFGKVLKDLSDVPLNNITAQHNGDRIMETLFYAVAIISLICGIVAMVRYEAKASKFRPVKPIY